MVSNRWHIQCKFEPRDIWVGLYWNVEGSPWPRCWHFYICLLPCCLIHIWQQNVWKGPINPDK
jgi:hypothetical protein